MSVHSSVQTTLGQDPAPDTLPIQAERAEEWDEEEWDDEDGDEWDDDGWDSFEEDDDEQYSPADDEEGW